MPDYLEECSKTPGFSEEDFCSRCYQPLCTRSQATSFDRRVQTWLERLFINPPRKDDPKIASQDFREVNLIRWNDPHSPPKFINTPNPGKITLASPIVPNGATITLDEE